MKNTGVINKIRLICYDDQNVQRWKQSKRGVCNVCCNMDVTVNCQLTQSQLTNYNNNDNR